jgi:Domain of unknown function (DUF4129)
VAGIIGLAAIAGYGWAATQSVRYPAPWSAPWHFGPVGCWLAARNAFIRVLVPGGIAIVLAWPYTGLSDARHCPRFLQQATSSYWCGLGWFPPAALPPHSAFTLPDLRWLWLAISAAAVGYLVVALVRQRRGRPQPMVAADPPLSNRPDITGIADEALAAMMLERDPRRAILACYQQMERTLASRGVSRKPEETAQEYAGRVLLQSGAPAKPVRALTFLFHVAGFSVRTMNETMRANAINSLRAIREGVQ